MRLQWLEMEICTHKIQMTKFGNIQNKFVSLIDSQTDNSQPNYNFSIANVPQLYINLIVYFRCSFFLSLSENSQLGSCHKISTK